MSKLTVKQQKFAEQLVKTGNQKEAYMAAYSCKNMGESTIYSRAHDEAKKPAVKKYIDSLRADLKKKALVETSHIIKKLLENVDLAQELGQISASNQALKLLGDHLGIWNEQPVNIDTQGGKAVVSLPANNRDICSE